MVTKNGSTNADGFIRKRVSSLKPSPENSDLYHSDDGDLDALAAAIKRNSCDPLVITADNYIVSGHRRRNALLINGRGFVRCKVLPVRRDSMAKDDYIALLRDYNQQRSKTVGDEVREELVDMAPEGVSAGLHRVHFESICAPELNGLESLEIEGQKKRYNISADKMEHVRHILLVVEQRKAYWPLSVRGVHYPLLNYDFIRGIYHPRREEPDFGIPRQLRYENDRNSYQATSDLITRLRLRGEIPWQAFDDFTRPMQEFFAFKDVRQFIRQQYKELFRGYWRDLLQSQPAHIEVVCEKNTIYHMALRVTEKYQIPTSSGRGFNSIDPWHDLYLRWVLSAKARLIVIILSDFDPEGEEIPHTAGRTLRDDFAMAEESIRIIKCGVTRDQIERYHLPAQNFAKEDSSNYKKFVERNGGEDTVWELEALDPEDMMRDLDETIRGVLDLELFNREKKREHKESAYIRKFRARALRALRELGK
jgi:hypothetical protein